MRIATRFIRPPRPVWRSLLSASLAVGAMHAHAAIPASERAVLLALYAQAGGSGWTDHAGWGGAAGTECTWHRVICDAAGDHVVQLALTSNHLSGTLPPLAALIRLRIANFDSNDLGGSIPALAGLHELESFGVEANHMTGSIPPLAGLTHLTHFSAAYNDLSGPIPPLAGLTQLRQFFVLQNRLSGPMPALTGLTHLSIFNASDNQLDAFGDVSGLANLTYLRVERNRIAGPIPSLAGLSNLLLFVADDNRIEGPLPDLSDLVHLSGLVLDHNAITGPLPPLGGLAALNDVVLDHNAMSGPIPDPPAPNHLVAGISTLCPNGFTPSTHPATNAAWNSATGVSPWNADCDPDRIFRDGFDGDWAERGERRRRGPGHSAPSNPSSKIASDR